MWNKNATIRAGRAGLLTAFVFAISGCAGDFVEDPNRPAPTRAVRSTPGGADALSETMRDTPGGGGGLNLVTVDLPNGTQPAELHTILDPLTGATAAATPPAQPPATAPALIVPVPGTVIEQAPAAGVIAGIPVRVAAQQHPADQFTLAADNEGNVLLHITSDSGIGTVTLERTGDIWPGVIHVTLVYANRPFTTLEGFKASEILGDERRLELKTAGNAADGKRDVLIPGFTRSKQIIIEWVDAYR